MAPIPLLDLLIPTDDLATLVLGQSYRDPALQSAKAALIAGDPVAAGERLAPVLRPEADPRPPHLLAWALVLDRSGRRAEAEELLQRLAAKHTVPVRHRLWAWSALRRWGIRPDPGPAELVQGVVVQVALEGGKGVEAVAAYGDGRAVYLARDGAVFEGIPEDESTAEIARRVVDRGRQLAGRAATQPPGRRGRVLSPGRVRYSLLSFGGLAETEEGRAVAAEGRSPLAGVFVAAGELLDALTPARVN